MNSFELNPHAVESAVSPEKNLGEYSKLSDQIRQAFMDKRLFKGYTEVLNAISLCYSLKVYCAGPLDKTYKDGLDKLLVKIENPHVTLEQLPPSCKRLVYDSLKDVPNPSKKNKEKPRRYFNTRIFGIKLA